MADISPSIPQHVGYIIDGNRRWARQHGLPAYEGHLAGYNAMKDVAVATLEAGVKYISAYAFSTENWKRDVAEVKRILNLVSRVATEDVSMFNKYNVRLKFIGSKVGLSDKILKSIEKAEAATANNTGGEFALCFNYGGQFEITEAVKKIVQSGVSADDITEELIAQNLYAPEVPPIDIVVRTSGEQRLSNFMLWRVAYSELLFLEKNWPDMTKDDVTAIMKEYSRRQRRFGG